ncbi:trimethylamine methyltransferase family protein [Desulforhopalus singaporensis]|uniref:Methyltransferase n=1 Tax=Desulforhopalus singaporensis TaxID=91360 RepID=A0A1H0UQE9_9BACT|nr:trimethylamine methyltransferase family protein [Desulforhopalus singaporensis]SDP68459.1 trimethylamine---corrinoid protein Co-methyltransferase [Desulforhopalus singaporensis]
MNNDLQKIHNSSMEILEKSGMRFQHPDIIDLLREKGIRVAGDTAFFKEQQLMEWVKKAPASFTVRARNPIYDITLGGDHMEVAAGYGAPYMIERSGKSRNATLDDYIQFVKLVHQSEHFNVNGGILVEPSDLNSRYNAPVMLYNTITHSDKALIGMEGNAVQMGMLMDMLKIVFGGEDELLKTPRMMTIVNTLSPLQMDRNALDTLIAYVSHGQPVFITPAAMAGFTAPITLAGMIALSNAETLAGIAVTQMIREGVPVAYGNQSTSADMRSGAFVVGSPEHVLSISLGAKLAKEYGLPCRSGGGSSDATQVCVQSGYESMMLLSACSNANVNMVILAAGALDSVKSMSVDKFIVDLEVISLVKRIREGVTINDETLVVDLINDAGPGGEFMTSMHTAKLCRSEVWTPEIGVRGRRGEKSHGEMILANIDRKKDQMLTAYEQPRIPAEMKTDLTNYLLAKKIDGKYLRG